MLVIGAVIPEIYNAFDIYWNSRESLPAEDILDKSNTDQLSLKQVNDLREVKKELILISPYFIPSDEMILNIKRHRENGVGKSEFSLITHQNDHN